VGLEIRYSRWRAVLGIVLLVVALAIPAANFLVNPADFRARWLDGWVSTIGFGIAWLWLAYVVWPAFRFLANGPEMVRVEAGELIFNPGERYNLRDLSAVEILRPWLRHPRVALGFGQNWVMIGTAFQALGERKSAEYIADALAEAARA
jgi:membrane protease YdiL (CAAX protease family)